MSLKFLKFQPNEYVLRYKNGKLFAEGAGLSFVCRTKNTSVAVLPVGSVDCPFVFEEVTADFQAVTIQGQLVFRIVDPKFAAVMLNYVVKLSGNNGYVGEDPQKKLGQRMVNNVKVSAKKQLERLSLDETMRTSDKLAASIYGELRGNAEIKQLGIELLGLSLLSILPNKETARALEAQAREQILKKADDAVYERRNASIEQERKVKENEYNTEISVEQKKRQVQEAQLEAQRAVQVMESRLEKEKLTSDIQLEKQRKELVELAAENARKQADVRAYELEACMKALSSVDKAVIQALANVDMKPGKLMALAFQGLAENASKIGQLNITPDLLSEILRHGEDENAQSDG
ncbi:hypothetical protein FACS1894211_12590 [Clostridia bacterium]|nr:hypothetical protein FACS1894211_12590 [Clostridia bacterium]